MVVVWKEAISGQTKALTDLADRFADQSRNMENSVERQTEDLNKAATFAVERSDEIRTALRLQAS